MDRNVLGGAVLLLLPVAAVIGWEQAVYAGSGLQVFPSVVAAQDGGKRACGAGPEPLLIALALWLLRTSLAHKRSVSG